MKHNVLHLLFIQVNDADNSAYIPKNIRFTRFYRLGLLWRSFAFKNPLFDSYLYSVSMFHLHLRIKIEMKSALTAYESATRLHLFSTKKGLLPKIENSLTCSMPEASTISRTLIHRSLKTISWIWLIISGTVTSTGLPEGCSYFIDMYAATFKLFYQIWNICTYRTHELHSTIWGFEI